MYFSQLEQGKIDFLVEYMSKVEEFLGKIISAEN